MELLLNRRSNRAGICTVAAADAFVSVDNVDIAFGNAGNGTLGCACATSDAIFSDFVSHYKYLHISVHIYSSIFTEKIKSILKKILKMIVLFFTYLYFCIIMLALSGHFQYLYFLRFE